MQRAVSLSAINPRHQNPVTTPPGSSMTGAVSHAGPGDQNPDHRGYLEGNGSRCRRQPVHRSARPDGRYGVFRECCLPRHSDETRPAVLPNIGRVVESVTTQSMAEGSASARTAAVVGVPGGEAPSEGALRLGGGGVWRS